MFLFFQIPAITRTALISLITLLTLLGIMLRPWKVSEAITALTGAGVLLLLGFLSPKDALATLLRDWNTFFFFLGIMSLAALAENRGTFRLAGCPGSTALWQQFAASLLQHLPTWKSHLNAAF